MRLAAYLVIEHIGLEDSLLEHLVKLLGEGAPVRRLGGVVEADLHHGLLARSQLQHVVARHLRAVLSVHLFLLTFDSDKRNS